MTNDPMSPDGVPGLYDEFRGYFVTDCRDDLPPELKANLKPGRWVPVAPPPAEPDPPVGG